MLISHFDGKPTLATIYCYTCGKFIPEILWYQAPDKRGLAPDLSENDETTLYFCNPVCSYTWWSK